MTIFSQVITAKRKKERNEFIALSSFYSLLSLYDARCKSQVCLTRLVTVTTRIARYLVVEISFCHFRDDVFDRYCAWTIPSGTSHAFLRWLTNSSTLRIDTLDVPQNAPSSNDRSQSPSTATNRPKFPAHEKNSDCFFFTTRTKQGRKVTIGVHVGANKTNYTYKTSIEDLIRSADQTIREVNVKATTAKM
jgi:hypothetical protein